VGNHRSNKRAKKQCQPFPPTRHNAPKTPGSRGLGRLGARTSISAGLLLMSVAGTTGPLALASTDGPLPAPPARGGAAAPAPPRLLGLPATWNSAAGSSSGVVPLTTQRTEEQAKPAAIAPPPPPAPAPRADTGGDQVGRWISEAVQTMQAQGIAVSAADAGSIRTIIQKESRGDPRAVNRWDSNAKAGHPSKGLMQCIDSTFNAYKLPGHADIYNPVDNIIAGVRYTIGRYGGFARHPGLVSLRKGKGYRGY
jgi:hypothetical protein